MMIQTRPPISLLAVAAALLFGAEAVLAQEATEPASSALFGEMVDVRVVNLEAVVTHDRGPNRGEHVSGLRAEDFVLEVDGRSIPIEYFTEVRGGVAEGPGGALEGASLPALALGETVPNRILVFVDNYYSIAARRDAVLRRLDEQLNHLGPHDYLAVVTYDGTSVEMISSWSRERGEIRRALRQVSRMPAYGLQRRSDFARLQTLHSYGGLSDGRGAVASTASSFSSIGFRGAQREPRLGAQLHSEMSGQVSRVALAATSALRGFARPDGRKTLLLLSGGLPSFGESEMLAEGWPTGFELGNYGTWWSNARGDRRLLAPLVDTANRLSYTVYPVDLGASAAAEQPSAADASLFDSLRRRNLQRDLDFFSEDALLFLARSTGGEAYLDSSRFTALQRLLEDTRSYYWIGFTPTWREDDGLHRVELRARQRDLDVRTRDSFSDLSRASVVSLQVESAHLFDSPLPSAARLAVSLGAPVRGRFGRMTVPLRVDLPLDRLTLRQNGEAWLGRAEVRIVASDDRGDVSPIPVLQVDLASNGRPVSGATQPFETMLELRRRPHRLLIAVHDPASGALFGKRLSIEP
ncbi:MAG: VWA domain-containing protein [Thermoanaerobaculia bacterium]|nr:VWA domain-containing protein [Thermoanaerobaculia bacterium]